MLNKVWGFKKIAIFFLVFTFGFVLGILATQQWPAYFMRQVELSDEVSALRHTDPRYPLVRSLLAFDYNNNVDFPELESLQEGMKNIINQELENEEIKDISVYFRDLESGHWIGVNEEDPYSPGSLFKMPVMMAYFKKAETDPALLTEKIIFRADETQEVTPNQEEVVLKDGQEYSIEELIRFMVIYSDNQAYALLVNHFDQKDIREIFKDLNVEFPPTVNTGSYKINVKEFSVFFRILRNATYLNREMSEKALELLSETTFKDGLASGVPTKTTVAHKFGLHVDTSSGLELELHDCGIIYASKPYILCIMTRGSEPASLKWSFKKISEFVFARVSGKDD